MVSPPGEIQQDHLAPPAKAEDPSTRELLEIGRPAVPHDRREIQPDGSNLEADETPAQAADDRLDLRKLRHPAIILDLRRLFLYIPSLKDHESRFYFSSPAGSSRAWATSCRRNTCAEPIFFVSIAP